MRRIALFILSIVLLCSGLYCQDKPDPFVLMTIPKSGTWLVKKCVKLLCDFDAQRASQDDSRHLRDKLLEAHKKNEYLFTHFFMGQFPYVDRMLQAYPNIKRVIVVRDLRDVAVSAMHYFLREGHYYEIFYPEIRLPIRKVKRMKTDAQLSIAIKHLVDAKGSLRHAMRYYRDPAAFVIRYEDLVGSKGGGSDQKQIEVIRALASCLNVSLSEEKLSYVADNLYGNQICVTREDTFRKGQIGRWKDFFKDDHKKMFAELFGQELIELGYEKDYNW